MSDVDVIICAVLIICSLYDGQIGCQSVMGDLGNVKHSWPQL
jgi:hypothetical protein